MKLLVVGALDIRPKTIDVRESGKLQPLMTIRKPWFFARFRLYDSSGRHFATCITPYASGLVKKNSQRIVDPLGREIAKIVGNWASWELQFLAAGNELLAEYKQGPFSFACPDEYTRSVVFGSAVALHFMPAGAVPSGKWK
jgi:hypothetical protein